VDGVVEGRLARLMKTFPAIAEGWLAHAKGLPESDSLPVGRCLPSHPALAVPFSQNP